MSEVQTASEPSPTAPADGVVADQILDDEPTKTPEAPALEVAPAKDEEPLLADIAPPAPKKKEAAPEPKPEPKAVEPEPEADPLLGDEPEAKPEGDREEQIDPDAHWAVGQVSPEDEEFFGRFKTPGDLARSYNELRRLQGKMVKLPDPLADDEEMGKFYDKIGRPKQPGDYKLALPNDLDDDAMKRTQDMLEVAHKTGARQETVEALYDWFTGEAQKAIEADEAAMRAAHSENLEVLRGEWRGEAYTRNVEGATRALEVWGGPEMSKSLANVQLADGTKLKANPDFIRLMHRVHVGMADSAAPEAIASGLQESYTLEECKAEKARVMELGPKASPADHQKVSAMYKNYYETRGTNTVIGPGRQHGMR